MQLYEHMRHCLTWLYQQWGITIPTSTQLNLKITIFVIFLTTLFTPELVHCTTLSAF